MILIIHVLYYLIIILFFIPYCKYIFNLVKYFLKVFVIENMFLCVVYFFIIIVIGWSIQRHLFCTIWEELKTMYRSDGAHTCHNLLYNHFYHYYCVYNYYNILCIFILFILLDVYFIIIFMLILSQCYMRVYLIICRTIDILNCCPFICLLYRGRVVKVFNREHLLVLLFTVCNSMLGTGLDNIIYSNDA